MINSLKPFSVEDFPKTISDFTAPADCETLGFYTCPISWPEIISGGCYVLSQKTTFTDAEATCTTLFNGTVHFSYPTSSQESLALQSLTIKCLPTYKIFKTMILVLALNYTDAFYGLQTGLSGYTEQGAIEHKAVWINLQMSGNVTKDITNTVINDDSIPWAAGKIYL